MAHQIVLSISLLLGCYCACVPVDSSPKPDPGQMIRNAMLKERENDEASTSTGDGCAGTASNFNMQIKFYDTSYAFSVTVTDKNSGKPMAGYGVCFVIPGEKPYRDRRFTDKQGNVDFSLAVDMLEKVGPGDAAQSYVMIVGQKTKIDLSISSAYRDVMTKVREREAAKRLGVPKCSGRYGLDMCPATYSVGRCYDGTSVVDEGCIDKNGFEE